MAASDSHTAYLARRAQKTRLTDDEFIAATRRVIALAKGEPEEWPGERRDRRDELNAPENCDSLFTATSAAASSSAWLAPPRAP